MSSFALTLYTNDGFWDAGPVDGYPWIYVGSLSAAESHNALFSHNVTRMLTVARRLPVKKPPSIIQEHETIQIDDHPDADILQVAQQCVDFIDKAAADAKNAHHSEGLSPSILVHCASGCSRSVVAVMFWLMQAPKRMRLDEAFSAIRVGRSFAGPNCGFIRQLRVLERHGGELEATQAEWKSYRNQDIRKVTGERRILGNEIHGEVDELEKRMQQFRSSVQNAVDVSGSSERPASPLHRTANDLSDRLDVVQIEQNGLLDDKATRFILKSARSKPERLIRALDGVK